MQNGMGVGKFGGDRGWLVGINQECIVKFGSDRGWLVSISQEYLGCEKQKL